MANIIEITLKATDKTKGVLGNVGSSLAGIGKMAIAGAAAGFAVAGAAAIGFGVKAVMAGADAEEMMSKLNVTFGKSSKGLIKNLDAFAAATGKSKFELRASATNMGAVIKALGATDEQAANMSESMTILSSDLGAFNNIPTADVAHKIQTALTGEFESLKSLGVVINQAKVDQELLNMGIEGGAAAATDYQKAMAIQNIIMQQTTDAQGAATRELGSFTGQMGKLKGALSDATIEIGMKLIPVLTPLITKFAAFASETLPKVVTWVAEKLVPALIDAGLWLGENVPKAIDTLKIFWDEKLRPLLEKATEWFRDKLVPAVQKLSEWLSDDVPKAIDTLKTFWDTKLKPFLEKAKEAWENISGAISGVIDWVGKVKDTLGSIKLPDWLTGHSPSPFENTLHGISDALKDISGTELPKFQAALEFTGTPAGAGFAAPGEMGAASGSSPVFNFYDTVVRDDQDIRNLAYEVVELLKA